MLLPRNPARSLSLAMRHALPGLVVAVLLSPGLAAAAGRSLAEASFESTGVEPGARGRIEVEMDSRSSRVSVKFRGLDPAGSYDLVADGVVQESFTPSGKGRASLRYALPARRGSALGFDPRSAQLALRRSGVDLLVYDLVGLGQTPGVLASERLGLERDDSAPRKARASATWKRKRNDDESLSIRLRRIPRGDYDVYVEGTPVGVIGVGKRRTGRLTLDPTLLPGGVPAVGSRFDVAQGSQVLFSGPLLAPAAGLNACRESASRQDLPAVAATSGSAEAKLEVKDDCRRQLEIEVEDVAAGTWTVRVDGLVKGSFDAALDPVRGEVRGEVEFDDEADDPDELPLDFEPVGAFVELLFGGNVVFAGVIDPSTPAASACTPSQAEVALAPGPAGAGSSGKAELDVEADCDAELEVEIEDVAAGTYDLFVDGVLRGSFQAVTDPKKGDVEGRIVFDTDPKPGEHLLDFDPDGALVEVRQSGALVASATLSGFGGGAGGGFACPEEEVEALLLATGPGVAGEAKAKRRVDDDCDADFEVELEDVAAGSYTLRVDGVDRGTITAALVAGTVRGAIDFDDDPDDPGELLLDFEPHGALVQVLQGATVLFERVMP